MEIEYNYDTVRVTFDDGTVEDFNLCGGEEIIGHETKPMEGETLDNLVNDYDCCPFCGSSNIKGDEFYYDAKSRRITCKSCDAQYNELYEAE